MVWAWLFVAVAAAVLLIVVMVLGMESPTAKVRHRERAAGVLPPLQAALDAWELEGTHVVLVAPNGGHRTDPALQADLAAGGVSNATTLRSTPHGRRAALDVWPLSFLTHVPVTSGGSALRWSSWEELPQAVKDDFATFGAWAEKRGLRWGGRWRSATFPNGDQPHVELPNWQSLPFP